MKTKILFVCLGNICRSPSAEAVFKGLVRKKGVQDKFEIDSSGTYAYHEGECADMRMQSHAVKRGYNLTSISRPFDSNRDWDRFDYIIAMDDSNLRNLRAMGRNKDDLKKLFKMTDFANNFSYNEIPDPYYGGEQGFELVLDLLEDAGEGFYEFLENSRSHN
ncbi:MAG TPA: low molecular weight protein-tyrosine-phosphatase [Bacteroidales bacterium]|jgi:protein-tyrosine phosphatase|nr:low molecular weight protein-tyrosine-phosphatase [Bacteroidales bacterium]|tara:strand:+ start:167 stop:652 length:486 start_codon:yes stop_codon:yes gene_type:complete